MIIDADCHGWRVWPCEIEAPGAHYATEVCAKIRTEDARTDTNDYSAEAAAAHPGQLRRLVDIDFFWSCSRRTPGAASRHGEWLSSL